MCSSDLDIRGDDAGRIAENKPIRLEGVVRSGGDDFVDEVRQIERGIARSLAGKWQNPTEESTTKEPFRLDMDVNPNEVAVHENEPVERPGVIRCSDQVDEVLGQRGLIRNIKQRILDQPLEEHRAPRGLYKIDLAEGPAVLENEPTPLRSDVVRCDYYTSEEPSVERGATKNLLQRWISQDVETPSPKFGPTSEKPAWILEMEQAPAGSGVFENQPLVRTDVIREISDEPEMIPVRETRNTRALWSKRILEDDDYYYDECSAPAVSRS